MLLPLSKTISFLSARIFTGSNHNQRMQVIMSSAVAVVTRPGCALSLVRSIGGLSTIVCQARATPVGRVEGGLVCRCLSGGISPAVVQSPRRPDLVELEYKELGLSEIDGEAGHVRIRQHVNPLSSSFMKPAEVPDWDDIFADPTLPLMVDIGCGSSRLLIWLAKRSPCARNYLGLEIRQRLVKRADCWVKGLNLKNIYFIFTNAAVSFERLVSSYPGPLALVSISCPDPHFKKKHHKRRVVQKPLIDSISKYLCPGGQIFVQSDVLDVAIDIRNQFDALTDVFQHVDVVDNLMKCDPQGWLLENPFGKRTEREIHAELEGAKIYRRLYHKRLD